MGEDSGEATRSLAHPCEHALDVGARRAAADAIGQVLVVGLDRREGELRLAVDAHRRDRAAGADEVDRAAFKTPSLRDVTLHAPYMHDGSQATLEEVMDHYVKGGAPGAPNLSEKMKPLDLTPEEVQALIAYMEALTSDVERPTAPATFPQ